VGSRSKARARAQASVAEGSGGSSPRAGTAGGSGGSSPRASTAGQSAPQPRQVYSPHPPTITAAAIVQAVQAVGVLLAAALALMATIQGKSYQTSGGIAITAIGFGGAILLGYIAFGLARTRRWSRTPALLTQLFTGIIGIYLVQSQRYDWGGPALVLCVAGFVLLLVPPSIKALTQSSPVSPSRS
jgi:hypothetical protein